MLINSGAAADPWTAQRACTADPDIDPSAVIRNSDLGRYTYVGPDSSLADSVLDDYGYAMGGNQINYATIGKFSNLATGVRINPGNHPWWRATLHHFTYRSQSYGFQMPDDEEVFEWRAKNRVQIGPDVWCGHNAVIMPGVSVGAGAALGAGAVATKDVPPFAVMVGTPARILRFRVDERIAEKLMRISWWDWPHERIGAALADFRKLSAEAFAEKYDQ